MSILQHPRERFHPFNTARILELSLKQVRVLVNHLGRLNTAPDLDFSPGAALLYPSPDARPLDSLAAHELPSELVILDGTWHHAHTMYRDIQALAELPRVSFTPSAPSRYRIRKEPRAECVSTLEALVYALKLCEPETEELDTLVQAFDRIIDAQLASQNDVPMQGRTRKARERAMRKIPRALVEEPDNLVIAYGESTRISRHEKKKERLPLYFVAVHLGTGRTFSCPVQPVHPLSAARLKHMALEPAVFDAALSLEAFRQAWLEFVPRGSVVAAYNKSTLDLLATAGAPTPRGLALKGAYFNLYRGGGSLDDIAQHEGLSPPDLSLPGRAGQRLGNAVALTRWLGDYAAGRIPDADSL